jgi:hypothetical protein
MKKSDAERQRPAPAAGRLTAPQTARATMRAGKSFVMEAEVRFTPLGLLAVGGLVAAILLSVPPIVRAAASARAARRISAS